MFTNFDKAIAGGVTAWLSTGVIAALETVFKTDLSVSTEATIMSVIGALLVYIIPNKAA